MNTFIDCGIGKADFIKKSSNRIRNFFKNSCSGIISVNRFLAVSVAKFSLASSIILRISIR